MNLIITTTKDYSDEFDYPIISIFKKEDKEKLLEIVRNADSDTYQELYFGTNEALYFTKDEVEELIHGAKEISDEDLAIVKPYLPRWASLDIINRITNGEY